MTSITYIGMDVHTTNFTLCCYSFEDDKVYATVQVKPKYTQILKYMKRLSLFWPKHGPRLFFCFLSR